MSQQSPVLKKLFVLTLLCLTFMFCSSPYPSTAPLGRLPSRGDLTTPSPTLTLPSSPVSVSVPATSAPHPDPPTRSGSRIAFLIQGLTGAASRIGHSLATEVDYVKTKLSSFLVRSYLHPRVPAVRPPPTRTTPVFIPPSKTVDLTNPALPTPGHAWKKTWSTGFTEVEELVYIQPLAEDSPRDDAPKVQLGSQYFAFPSVYHIKNSSWFVPGLFGMLVGAIIVLEALAQLETLRPTLETQPRAPAQTNLDYQVANTSVPGSNQVPSRYIESGLVVVMGVRLVAALTLATSNREVLVCMSSNLIVCRASNIGLWFDAIVARDLPLLEELCANLGTTVAIVRSSIHATVYGLEASVLDAWGIDSTQDYLYSRWSIRVHVQATHTLHSPCIPTLSYVDPQSQAPNLVVTRTPIHICVGGGHMYSSWTVQCILPSSLFMRNCRPDRNEVTGREWNTVVQSRIDWYILGLILRNFSTCPRLSATPAPLSVERGGCPLDPDHAPFERLVRVGGLSLDYHLVTLLVKVIVIPDSTFTLLLFGRNIPTKCTDSSPLCRGLMIEWVSQSADPPAEVIRPSNRNPVLKHRARQAIRPGYGIYRPPSVQATLTSDRQLERGGAGKRVLGHVEQDARATEAQTCPDQDEGAEGSRRRTRRGGRRAKERKERRGDAHSSCEGSRGD